MTRQTNSRGHISIHGSRIDSIIIHTERRTPYPYRKPKPLRKKMSSTDMSDCRVIAVALVSTVLASNLPPPPLSPCIPISVHLSVFGLPAWLPPSLRLGVPFSSGRSRAKCREPASMPSPNPNHQKHAQGRLDSRNESEPTNTATADPEPSAAEAATFCNKAACTQVCTHMGMHMGM